ncbi:MAG: TIGR03790 family protein, partial [Ignavibacteriaceae bacterium]|nr:TIGR03790 family protein [Ignavibacteriaceae bacterium]
MKTLYFFLFILFFLTVQAQAQDPTDAGIPDAYHVLVVYNTNSDTSLMVKDYYVNARGIPDPLNVVGLPLPEYEDITIDEETHRVKIVQVTDMIQDSVNNANNAEIPTRHAFKYFLDNIATPIKTHLENNNLLSTIRYILLVKGVPFKLQAARDYGGFQRGNLTVDGLLCMLNTPDYDSTFILETVFENNGLPNPYFNADPNLSMDYRFLSDHFIGGSGQHLSYLVSHLDGISFDVVKAIIDSSLNPDMSGTATWILDNDPTWAGGDGYFTLASDKLTELGFNVHYDPTDSWVTSYPGNVMGYSSWGTHAEDYNCNFNDSAWVKDSLQFNLANGSVFNTYESFNGNSLTTLNWRYVQPDDTCSGHTQGLATQFTQIGGTATMGHAWEPGANTVIANHIFFPAYQMGYNIVDAYYQGDTLLAWQNVLVADPLLRIFNCENTVITSDTIISSGDYLCNLIVPADVRLTIKSGETVNFRRNAKLKIYGFLELEEGSILNLNAYSELYQGQSSNLIVGQNAQINFKDHSTFTINDSFIFGDGSSFTFEGSCNIIINGTAELSENSTFNLVNGMSCKVNGSFTLNDGSTLKLQDNSSLNSYGCLILNSESTLNVNESSKFNSNGKLILNEGVIMNLQYSSPGYFILSGVIKSLGSLNNRVRINSLSEVDPIRCINVDTLLIQYTEINSASIVVLIMDGIQKPRMLSISNSNFSNSPQRNLFHVLNTEGVNLTLTDNSFTTGYPNYDGCLNFAGFKRVDLIRDTIQNITGPLWSVGVKSENNETLEIIECEIDNFNYGFQRGYIIQEDLENIEPIYNEDIRIYNCTLNGGQYNNGAAISTGMLEAYQVAGVKVDLNNISNFRTGIEINNADNFSLGITNNTITNYGLFGISVSNGSEALIKENIITADASTSAQCVGISVNQVNNPNILGNTIDVDEVVSNPGPGISLVSCNGEIRRNTIQNHLHGIEIGSSSPNLAENTIMNNIYSGLYVSAGSFPNLSETTSGEYTYPLTGYNIIRENGCSGNINAEIYFDHAGANLHLGCNTLADDRENSGQCDNTLLMDGIYAEGEIAAEENYWGNHPVYGHDPSERFGNEISVIYDHYLEDPCTYSLGEEFLVLRASSGEVIDTVYSSGIASNELTELESRYKTANGYYYNNQYLPAKQEYEGIIQNYGNSKGSIQACNRLYTIANLTNSSPAVFNQLKDFYLQKAVNQTDSLMIGILTHLGDLCLVSAEEFLPAITNFDEIAQQNPNTDIALYRQIDALTTSLLIPQDSSLNKGVLGKYSVTNLSEYTNKLSELLKTRGKSGLNSNEELIPKEFTLYQNFPNPFNPTTTIKYDLPQTSDVSLIIYDILGRKVKELVNTKQQAGRYEVQFDASNLASGVY